jgi:sugar phosphate isomerase/epimerase
MREEIQKIVSFGRNVFLWEDSCSGLFSYQNPYLIKEVIKPLRLDIVVDVSHSFIALRGDNEKLLDVINSVCNYAQYYHIVDSMGEKHDGLELGHGKINWSPLKPYMKNKPHIFEISLDDYNDCSPMIRSYQYFAAL